MNENQHPGFAAGGILLIQAFVLSLFYLMIAFAPEDTASYSLHHGNSTTLLLAGLCVVAVWMASIAFCVFAEREKRSKRSI